MPVWLETVLVALIVGGAVVWAVRRFQRARRAADSESPCSACGQVGACPLDSSGAGRAGCPSAGPRDRTTTPS